MEIRLPGLNKVTASAPSFWLSQPQKGPSWQRLCSGMEKVINNEYERSIWKKRLPFQTVFLGALPYHLISPFHFPFTVAALVGANTSLGFAGVLKGIGREMRRESGGPSEIHSYLDQACRLWEWFWVISLSRAKCHCVSFFIKCNTVLKPWKDTYICMYIHGPYNPPFKGSLEDWMPSGREAAAHPCPPPPRPKPPHLFENWRGNRT